MAEAIHELGHACALLAGHGGAGVSQVVEGQVLSCGPSSRLAPTESCCEDVAIVVQDGGPAVQGGLGQVGFRVAL